MILRSNMRIINLDEKLPNTDFAENTVYIS